VKLWDAASGKSIASLPPHAGLSWYPTFSTNGQFLTAAVDGSGRVWDTTSLRELATLKLYANAILSTAFSPDGQRLVTGGVIGATLRPAIQIWDWSAQRDLISLWSQSDFTGWTQFSPDGNTLLAVSWHGFVDLWHAPSWEEIEASEKGPKTP